MLHAVKSVGAQPRLRTALARNIAEIRAAQRLRYRVFAEEMGARVPGREQGIDCDVFDAYCDHLIVTDTASGDVVGTYRLLNGAQARRAGGFYADQEFDLARLDACEGVPFAYGRVTKLVVDEHGRRRRAQVYLLAGEVELGEPGRRYYGVIRSAYARLGFDDALLRRAAEGWR